MKTRTRSPRFGCWLLLLVPAFASAARAHPQTRWKQAALAEVPADLAIATEFIPLTNAPAYLVRSSIAWSSDGTTVAYAARRGEREWLPVVGSDVGGSYDVVGRPIVAGGHAFFLVGRIKEAGTADTWLWIDGEHYGPEDSMGDIAVSADGKRVAYWTQPGAINGNSDRLTSQTHYLALAHERAANKWTVRRSEEWVDEPGVPPIFSSNGKLVFTSALSHSGWVALRLEGKREREVSDTYPGIPSIAISDDGSALAVVRTTATDAPYPSQLFFKGKRVAKKYDRISLPVVDPTGKLVAFVLQLDGLLTVATAKDKRPEGRYDHILEPLFDPSSKRIAFVANLAGRPREHPAGDFVGGESFVVVRPAGGKGDWKEHPRYEYVRDLVWDAAGERIAYCAKADDGWRVVCGDARSEAHDDVGRPFFAEDGGSIGFGSRDGRELWWRVLAID